MIALISAKNKLKLTQLCCKMMRT